MWEKEYKKENGFLNRKGYRQLLFEFDYKKINSHFNVLSVQLMIGQFKET